VLPTVNGNYTHAFVSFGDGRNSVGIVIDHDSSEVVERMAYQPYGDLDADYRPARWNYNYERFKFGGHLDTWESALIDMGARFYSPQLRRFMSPDPLAIHGATGDLNPYEYANGNPIRFTDPTGLWSEDDTRTVVGIASAFAAFAGVIELAGREGIPPNAAGDSLGDVGSSTLNSAAVADDSLASMITGIGGKLGQTGLEQGTKSALTSVAQNALRPPVAPGTSGFLAGPITPPPPDMRFNGQTLSLTDSRSGHETEYQWRAWSGRKGYWDPKYQNLADKGPIPAGRYLARQSQLQRYSDISVGQKFKAWWGRGTWPGGTDAWGNSRVFLEPLPGTYTYGRSGFSIHGGIEPGSAGCIDLTFGMDSFAATFQQQGRDLVLEVSY
jgi:RHS repeat-associated protein